MVAHGATYPTKVIKNATKKKIAFFCLLLVADKINHMLML